MLDTVVIKNCSRMAWSRTIDYSLGVVCQAASISTVYKQAFPLFGSIIQQLALLSNSHLALFSWLIFPCNPISTFSSTNWLCQTQTHNSQIPAGLVKNYLTLRYTRSSKLSILIPQLAWSLAVSQHARHEGTSCPLSTTTNWPDC